MKLPYASSAARVVMSIVALAAWLSISNHCAVGAVLTAQEQSMAPMHCHSEQPSPSKQNSSEETPCCKVLRATLTGEAKLVQVANQIFLQVSSGLIFELIFANGTYFHLEPLELDVGPPFAVSFAESVLQRSLLAHAPPPLA